MNVEEKLVGNGPAIWGGCVTRRKHRVESWYFSQKSVTVQYFNCVLMRVSGCKNHYKTVLSAGAKAKSVTNNLPILSVFCLLYTSDAADDLTRVDLVGR